MRHKKVRITIGGLAEFIALTAIGGGIAIPTDVDKVPLEWLKGSPFSNYTIDLLDAIVYDTNDGDDTLDGGAGHNDVCDGGEGTDTAAPSVKRS